MKKFRKEIDATLQQLLINAEATKHAHLSELEKELLEKFQESLIEHLFSLGHFLKKSSSATEQKLLKFQKINSFPKISHRLSQLWEKSHFRLPDQTQRKQ